VNIEKDSAHSLDFLPGAGVVLDEIVPLVEAVSLMVTRGGVLDPPHCALAIGGYVFVGPELVAGQERSHAEVEEPTPGAQDRGIIELVPAGAAAAVMAGEELSLGIGLVSAVFQAGKEQGFIQDFSKPSPEAPAVVAGTVMERRVFVAFVQTVAELVQAEDARAIGEVYARDDVVAVVVEIAAGAFYDPDYTSSDSDHTSCPALRFTTEVTESTEEGRAPLTTYYASLCGPETPWQSRTFFNAEGAGERGERMRLMFLALNSIRDLMTLDDEKLLKRHAGRCQGGFSAVQKAKN